MDRHWASLSNNTASVEENHKAPRAKAELNLLDLLGNITSRPSLERLTLNLVVAPNYYADLLSWPR